MRSSSLKKGFTIIEIIVAVSIFVIVMLISIMALLSSINANRKAQGVSIVISNLNLAVEDFLLFFKIFLAGNIAVQMGV